MNFLFSLFTGGGSTKTLIYVAIGLAVLTGLGYARHEIRRADEAELQVRMLHEQMAEIEAQHQRVVNSLQEAADSANKRAEQSTMIREAVHAAPTTASCATSPAVRAMLDGMRQRAPRAAD